VLNCGEDTNLEIDVNNIESTNETLICELSRMALRILAFYNLDDSTNPAKRKIDEQQNGDGLVMAL
jgi:hypothetical protein